MVQALPIAFSLFSAASSFGQAGIAKAQGKAARQQAEMEKTDYKIRAAQEDSANLADFYSTIGAIDAQFAGAGVGRSLDSQTGQALEKSLADSSMSNRLNTRNSYSRKVMQTDYAGKLAQFKSNADAFGYKAQGITSLFSAAQSGMDMFGGGKNKSAWPGGW